MHMIKYSYCIWTFLLLFIFSHRKFRIFWNIETCSNLIYFQLKNPVYVFITVGSTVETFIIGGFATFAPKLFQEFHNMDLADAGFIMGNDKLLNS